MNGPGERTHTRHHTCFTAWNNHSPRHPHQEIGGKLSEESVDSLRRIPAAGHQHGLGAAVAHVLELNVAQPQDVALEDLTVELPDSTAEALSIDGGGGLSAILGGRVSLGPQHLIDQQLLE